MLAQLQSVHVWSEGGLKERSIRQLSGGERRRVALALALGFADLVSGRGRLRCNLIVLDEVGQCRQLQPSVFLLLILPCCDKRCLRCNLDVLGKVCIIVL